MAFREVWNEYPRVLKVAYVAFAASIVLSAFGVMTGRTEPWLLIWLPISAVVMGLLLLFDVAGSARGMAAGMKHPQMFGVDYSRSLFARPGYARFFGAMMIFVAAGMSYGILLDQA